MRQRVPLLLSTVFFFACVPALLAQNVIQLQQFEQTGKVVSGAPGVLVFDVLGQKYAAQIDTKEVNLTTIVELNAKAFPSFLQSGMSVRFNATLDARGRKITQPIQHLTVFSPTTETRYGVFGDEPIAPPAAAPALGGAQVGVGAAIAAAQPPAAERPAGGESFVVGTVSRVRKNDITITLPSSKLEAELADDVTIDVSVTDKAVALSMLRLGDAVHVVGGKAKDGKVYANKIVATLERPLGEAPSAKKPPRRITPDKVAGNADADAINPAEDFGVAATEAAEAAALEAKPGRARILKVN